MKEFYILFFTNYGESTGYGLVLAVCLFFSIHLVVGAFLNIIILINKFGGRNDRH